MVGFDDILELHSTIKALEERQRRLDQLARSFIKESEDLNDVIGTLRIDYEILKSKAKQK